MSEPYLAQPMAKGQPGQTAFVRVRLLHGDDAGVFSKGPRIVVETLDILGGCTDPGSVLYVHPDAIVTMAEAKRAVGGAK